MATTVNQKFEMAVLPVSDVDRAKNFYQGLGWRMDGDFNDGKDFGGPLVPTDDRHIGEKQLRMDVALFLPFRCTKQRQTAAKGGTKRNLKPVRFSLVDASCRSVQPTAAKPG